MFKYLLLSAHYHDTHTGDKMLTVQTEQNFNFTINKLFFPGIVYDKWNIADISINLLMAHLYIFCKGSVCCMI